MATAAMRRAGTTRVSRHVLTHPSRIFQLYPPGKLMMLNYSDDRVVTRWIHHRFVACFIVNACVCSEVREIKLTPALVSDHLPYAVRKALRQAVAQDGS